MEFLTTSLLQLTFGMFSIPLFYFVPNKSFLTITIVALIGAILDLFLKFFILQTFFKFLIPYVETNMIVLILMKVALFIFTLYVFGRHLHVNNYQMKGGELHNG